MYVWIKALHAAAIVTWMAGMITAPTIISRGTGRDRILAMRWQFSRVTTPAMILALAFGLWLAQDGSWFRAAWVQAKLVLVVGLTGLHGVLSGQLRRLSTDAAHVAPKWVAQLSTITILAVLAIAVLAVVKPELR